MFKVVFIDRYHGNYLVHQQMFEVVCTTDRYRDNCLVHQQMFEVVCTTDR